MTKAEKRRRVRALTRQIEDAIQVLAETFMALDELHMERGELLYAPEEEVKA